MRKDGVRLKNTDPMYTVVPHIMPKRSDAQNAINLDIPLEPIEKYIRQKREEGYKLSHMGIVIAAYVRTVAEYPLLNRFIMNKKIYARNEIAVGMVVLKASDNDSETMSKMYFEPEDDVITVQKKIDDFVAQNRKDETQNSTDKIIKTLLSIPGLLRNGVNILRWMDKHGLMPKAIIDASPFHNSMVITNLGSIRTNYIYHHIYDFGTTGQIVAMGNLREVLKRKGNEITTERCIPLGVVMDERLCSGYYYATAFRSFTAYMKNPALLEGPPAKVVKDPCI